ncbi:hypothetical protein B4168_2588 [Anoxybacillus flavithermus]|nr:hypothetical protein B4168_2588 [Anoxybacillus flavithermus]
MSDEKEGEKLGLYLTYEELKPIIKSQQEAEQALFLSYL